jgi:hypothetical protein
MWANCTYHKINRLNDGGDFSEQIKMGFSPGIFDSQLCGLSFVYN